jgi:hypothetical protein
VAEVVLVAVEELDEVLRGLWGGEVVVLALSVEVGF